MVHWTELIEWNELVEQPDLIAWIDGLIHSCTLSEEQKLECESMNTEDIEEEVRDFMIAYLLMNQVNRIDAGMSYNQTDIKYKLKQIIESKY